MDYVGSEPHETVSDTNCLKGSEESNLSSVHEPFTILRHPPAGRCPLLNSNTSESKHFVSYLKATMRRPAYVSIRINMRMHSDLHDFNNRWITSAYRRRRDKSAKDWPSIWVWASPSKRVRPGEICEIFRTAVQSQPAPRPQRRGSRHVRPTIKLHIKLNTRASSQ